MSTSIRPAKAIIKFDDYSRLDLRIGRVVECTEHPNADKLLILQVDVGFDRRQICAGLKGTYQPADLLGKLLVVAVNTESRLMRGIMSRGVIMTARMMTTTSDGSDQETLSIVTPPHDMPPGSIVS